MGGKPAGQEGGKEGSRSSRRYMGEFWGEGLWTTEIKGLSLSSPYSHLGLSLPPCASSLPLPTHTSCPGGLRKDRHLQCQHWEHFSYLSTEENKSIPRRYNFSESRVLTMTLWNPLCSIIFFIKAPSTPPKQMTSSSWFEVGGILAGPSLVLRAFTSCRKGVGL